MLAKRDTAGVWELDDGVNFYANGRNACLAYHDTAPKPDFLELVDENHIAEHRYKYWDYGGGFWSYSLHDYEDIWDDLPWDASATEPWITRDGNGVWHLLVHVPTEGFSDDWYGASHQRNLYYVTIDTNSILTKELVAASHTELDSQSSFHPIVNRGASYENGRYRSICVDPAGNVHALLSPDPHIQEITGGTEVRTRLVYLTNTGGVWSTTTLLDPGSDYGDAGAGASIACTPDGTIAVAAVYLPRVNTGSFAGPAQLYYMWKDGSGDWVSSVIADRSDGYVAGDGERGTGLYPCLRFDSRSRPHIVFTDLAAQHFSGFGQEAYSGTVRYATRSSATSGDWTFKTVISKDDYGKGVADFSAYFPLVLISPLDDSVVIGAEILIYDGIIAGAFAFEMTEYVIQAPFHSEHGTPLDWLRGHYPDALDLEAADISDSDGDGHFAWMEFVARTDPTNDTSCMRVLDLRPGPAASIEWSSVSGMTYRVVGASNLIPAEFSPLAGATLVRSHAETTTFTNVPSDRSFFRIECAR